MVFLFSLGLYIVSCKKNYYYHIIYFFKPYNFSKLLVRVLFEITKVFKWTRVIWSKNFMLPNCLKISWKLNSNINVPGYFCSKNSLLYSPIKVCAFSLKARKWIFESLSHLDTRFNYCLPSNILPHRTRNIYFYQQVFKVINSLDVKIETPGAHDACKNPIRSFA